MAGTKTVLTRDQLRVVQAAYDGFRERCAWATFGEIDRLFATGRRRLDVGQVMQTIPNTVLIPLGAPLSIAAGVPLQLRLEGIACCSGSEDDIELSLRALRWMAKQERKPIPPDADGATVAMVTSDQFMRALRLPKSRSCQVRRVGAILLLEQWGWSVGGTDDAGVWHYTLNRDIRRFRDVWTLDDYRAAQEKWGEERRPRFDQFVVNQTLPAAPADEPQVPARSYVDAEVVSTIEAKQTDSAWQCDKLLHLIAELNDNYASGHAHSAHAMLRAILDHVGPLFGFPDFAQVVNNYAGWSRTDKSYMRRLLETKLQGDEALHRPISKKGGSQLSIEDLPPRRQLNRLLEECAALL